MKSLNNRKLTLCAAFIIIAALFLFSSIVSSETNEPPYFVSLAGNKTAYVGQEISFTIEAKDPDGDPIHFGSSATPISADYRDNGNGTASFSWTPTEAGKFLMIFIICDDYHNYIEMNTEHIMITVFSTAPSCTEMEARF